MTVCLRGPRQTWVRVLQVVLAPDGFGRRLMAASHSLEARASHARRVEVLAAFNSLVLIRPESDMSYSWC